MFEYTALVDAPVKRFTSIVTDPEPDETPIVLAVVAAAPPIAVAVIEAPVLLMAIEPETISEPPALAAAVEPEPEPIAILREPIAPTSPTPRPVRTFVPRAEPAPRPSMVPTLIGIAAAGITAFWWMRRESHGRGR